MNHLWLAQAFPTNKYLHSVQPNIYTIMNSYRKNGSQEFSKWRKKIESSRHIKVLSIKIKISNEIFQQIAKFFAFCSVCELEMESFTTVFLSTRKRFLSMPCFFSPQLCSSLFFSLFFLLQRNKKWMIY